MTKEEILQNAIRGFVQEFAQVAQAESAGLCGDKDAMRGYLNVADLAMDQAWNALVDEAGYTEREVSQIRHAAHSAHAKCMHWHPCGAIRVDGRSYPWRFDVDNDA